MSPVSIDRRLEARVLSKLEGLPVLSVYARTRGWPFLISWGHRVSGLMLVVFGWYHIYTLSLLTMPAHYDAKMRIFGSAFFGFLEWALAIPVSFHAFNGTRLVLYEIFGVRQDEALIKWTLGLSILYSGLLGVLMIRHKEQVSAVFFWLTVLVGGLALAYAVFSKVWRTRHSLLWKLQRTTGAYLFLMIPAHMLFMHLNYAAAHDAETVLIRMQNGLIKFVDLSLVVGILFHGGYGLTSVLMDYIGAGMIRIALAALVLLMTLFFAGVGVRLILFP